MKDIKSLYLTAKSSGKSSDISAYTEAVNELLANNPKDYMLHLEYIISSDIGLETFDSFIEKYGLSVAAYDDVMACFEKCIGKCERDGKDASEYQKKTKKLKEFKEQHSTCFRMFETFMDDYIAEPIEEKSHGKLKYDFRLVRDAKTGRQLKIVYSLDNSKYEDIKGTHVAQQQRQDMTSDQKLAYNRKYGDTDHLSSGQKVLAIVDMETGERLKEADVTGVFGYNDSDVFHIKVGEVETRANYKSTFLPRRKGENKNRAEDYRHITTREILGKGRGAKMNDIDYDNHHDSVAFIHSRKTPKVFSVYNPADVAEIKVIFKKIFNYGYADPETTCSKYNIDPYSINKYPDIMKVFSKEDIKQNMEELLRYYEKTIAAKKENPEKETTMNLFQIINAAKDLQTHLSTLDNDYKRFESEVKALFIKEFPNQHRASRKDPRHSLDVKKEYVDVYYSFNEDGKQNSRLLVGMINTFGECAIPDALITASKFGDSALNTSLKYLESVENFQTAGHFQWISECTKEVAPEGYKNNILTEMESLSLQAIVDNMRSRNRAVFREATLSGNDDAVFEYSEEELKALSELISFKEYQLTCMENMDDLVNLQKEIYSLYEEYDGLEGESAGAIADMLPPSSSGDGEMTESPWMVNTRNKKTGDAPSWLANNHNLDYNADDPKPKSSNDEESIEDFKRPSAGGAEPGSDDTGSEYSNRLSDTSSSGQSSSGSTNNYYYYTYNNSLNKNSHSFNKDSSSHDNHSKHDHSVSNDSSVHNSTRRVTDDHSTNKRVHSHDYNTPAPEDADEDIQEESGKPWEVGNFLHSDVYIEDVGDADDLRPESDHPIKDTLMDIDRKLVRGGQKVKKGLQNVQNAGRAAMKPVNRATGWVGKVISDWKDADETKIKEKMADPHARNNLFSAIGTCIKTGSLLKAGLLFNPIFLFLSVTKQAGKNKNMFRIRNEMIGEIKMEIKIIDKKIDDARANGDKNASYKLMRLKNELEKKLARVGGGKGAAKSL